MQLLNPVIVLYKAAKYTFGKALKKAKRDYIEKLENKLSSNDSRELWQGFQLMTYTKQSMSL